MNIRTVPVMLIAGLLAPGLAGAGEPAAPAKAAVASHILLTPDQVSWGACPPALPPGPQCAVVEGDPKTPDALFALRARLPDGYQIPPHFHPADEHVVVLSGVFNMGLGDKLDRAASHALPAGGFMVMPAGKHHYAWAKGETVIQLYAIGPWDLIYVNPKDDPRTASK